MTAKEKWFVTTKKADFEKIAERFQISPVLARIIRNRDIIGETQTDYFLNGTLEQLHDPEQMKDMKKGAGILARKIKDGSSIRIIGDYDVDGICSSYILQRVIRELGGKVSVQIPHRIRDGYGINEQLVNDAANEQVDTIITCDNGIAAYQEVGLAKKLGMTVVITDHHEVPYLETKEDEGEIRKELLPPADAVIDPKQKDCDYPYKGICGGVVAWKFAGTLAKIMQMEEKTADSLLKELLVFAAFATICDVMELLDENRIIVKYGLKEMENTENPGLSNLIALNGLSGKKITTFHVGFVLGPCLNAAGRLDSAHRALELLDAKTQREAVVAAKDMISMNEERKRKTEEFFNQAIQTMENGIYEKDRVIVLYLPECHESLAGIIAGRIRERYQKPVFVLTKGEEGIKGSGRSIDSYHMYEALHSVEELLTKYGGHKLAAGLSMPERYIDVLRQRLNKECNLTEDDFTMKVSIDVPMPFSYATPELIESFQRLEPYGNGNPKPLFAQKDIEVLKVSIVGKNKTTARCVLRDAQNNRMEAVYFGDAREFEEQLKQHNNLVRVVYYPDINEFGGKRKVQIVIRHYGFS